jgi:hypothetical protein
MTTSTMKLIEKITLTATPASITLGSGGTIPQTYTDLFLVVSGRTTAAGATDIIVSFNGVTTGYNRRILYTSNGTSAAGAYDTTRSIGAIGGTNFTANTFGNLEAVIPNYSGSANKSVSVNNVAENNNAAMYIEALALSWANTAAITSIQLSPNSGNFAAGSTFYLYGVSELTPGVVATGGTLTSGTSFNYHTFTSTSSFVVTSPGIVEYLIVSGGGGGGGGDVGSGGGAGGFLTGTKYVTAGTYTVTIGAGGVGSATPGGSNRGANGTDSSALSISSLGGGGGGSWGSTGGAAGGSGGGGYTAQGAGTAGQGYAGGGGVGGGNGYPQGGGGGAGAVGGTGVANSKAGDGGIGRISTITGSAVYYAGGGGGSSEGSPATRGFGGQGGGGNGGSQWQSIGADNGVANTGGGGGGADPGQGGTGGSGIVILRYAK